MKFIENYNLDISKYIEKDYKGLEYLSWSVAYKLAMEQDNDMTYQVIEDNDGVPYFSRGKTHFVKTVVIMNGQPKAMILPVMDNKHNAVAEPDSRDVSDAIMRCLVKNIAMFGIGLSLYTGEDIAKYKDDNVINQKIEKATKQIDDAMAIENQLIKKVLEVAITKEIPDNVKEYFKKLSDNIYSDSYSEEQYKKDMVNLSKLPEAKK